MSSSSLSFIDSRHHRHTTRNDVTFSISICLFVSTAYWIYCDLRRSKSRNYKRSNSNNRSHLDDSDGKYSNYSRTSRFVVGQEDTNETMNEEDDEEEEKREQYLPHDKRGSRRRNSKKIVSCMDYEEDYRYGSTTDLNVRLDHFFQQDNESMSTMKRDILESGISVRGYHIANGTLLDGILPLSTTSRGSAAMMSYFRKYMIALTDLCGQSQKDGINNNNCNSNNNNNNSHDNSHTNTNNNNNNNNNRMGYIVLCIAENKLVTDMLAERMNQAGTSESALSELPMYHYNDSTGIPMLKAAFSYFLTKRFLYPQINNLSIEDALVAIPGKNLAIGSGAAPLLSNLFYLLGDGSTYSGSFDCCLIPTPYYAAFELDMYLIAGIVPYPVHSECYNNHSTSHYLSPPCTPSNKDLDNAYNQAVQDGYNPRFLLLTNPNNPLGTIYPPAEILRMVSWCRNKKSTMHIIVDEIYALSVHKPNGQNGFQSIIQVLGNDLRNDVHFVWAMSKDFGASGLRCGVIYSQNEMLLRGLSNMHQFCGIPGPFQYMISEVLTDDIFLDTFLERSRNRILYSYSICTQKLHEMVLPFTHAEAGIFVYVDFSSLLPQKTIEYERQLTELLFDIKLVFTPGESQRDPNPGMYRICYAWVSPDILQIAMERLSRLVAKIRKMDWDDLVGNHSNSTGHIRNEDTRRRTIQSILAG